MSDEPNDRLVTREHLYAQVWAEPMLKVAARYSVSSSFLARVCARLNVPRPQRGHWAKLAVGKAERQPLLPAARAGDELAWRRADNTQFVRRPAPQAPVPSVVQLRASKPAKTGLHPLLAGVAAHLVVGRETRDTGFMKPSKRLLPDLIVSKTTLDHGVRLANQVYQAIEAQGGRVVLAPSDSRDVRRDDVDQREKPIKGHHYADVWHPQRPTVAYFGTVAIGLTIYETTERVEVCYAGSGQGWVRVSSLSPQRLKALTSQYWSTSQQDMRSGRYCVKAYSPYYGADWTKQWLESKDGRVAVDEVAATLANAAPVIARLVAEERKREEERRRRWDEERAEERRKAEIARQKKALEDARSDLFDVIRAWDEAQAIYRFFAQAEQQMAELSADSREVVAQRLQRARTMIGDEHPLQRLANWRPPEDR